MSDQKLRYMYVCVRAYVYVCVYVYGKRDFEGQLRLLGTARMYAAYY